MEITEQISTKLQYLAIACTPSDEDFEAANKAWREILVSAIKGGTLIPRPHVCYFVDNGSGIELIWPFILTGRVNDDDPWRYMGTASYALTLKMKSQEEALNRMFDSHQEWYKESLKRIKKKLKLHDSLLAGNHFNNTYGIAPTIGNLKNWILEKYGPSISARATFTEDKKHGIIWVEDFDLEFPDCSIYFEKNVREEDIHIFCREILARQVEIEERLNKQSNGKGLPSSTSARAVKAISEKTPSQRKSTIDRNAQMEKRYHQLRGQGLDWEKTIQRLCIESEDFGIDNSKGENAKIQIRRILKDRGIKNSTK